LKTQISLPTLSRLELLRYRIKTLKVCECNGNQDFRITSASRDQIDGRSVKFKKQEKNPKNARKWISHGVGQDLFLSFFEEKEVWRCLQGGFSMDFKNRLRKIKS